MTPLNNPAVSFEGITFGRHLTTLLLSEFINPFPLLLGGGDTASRTGGFFGVIPFLSPAMSRTEPAKRETPPEASVLRSGGRGLVL